MKFPFQQQLNEMDCGPTCIYIISKHHGRNFSIEKLRELTEIGKDGVNLLGISDAAEKIGYRTQSVQLNITELKEAQLPCILHWGQNHFVVLYKIKKEQYFIADPSNKLDFISNIPTDSGYLAKVLLPKGLQTNYNRQVQYHEGLLAQAQIITADLKLSDRILNQFKSVIKNN